MFCRYKLFPGDILTTLKCFMKHALLHEDLPQLNLFVFDWRYKQGLLFGVHNQDSLRIVDPS